MNNERSNELRKLMETLAEKPSQARHVRVLINKLLGRSRDASLADLLEEFYEKQAVAPINMGGLYANAPSIETFCQVSPLHQASVMPCSSVSFLGEQHPDAITKLAKEGELRCPEVSLYRGRQHSYSFSVLFDIPIFFMSEAPKAIVREMSSPHYDAVYAVGGSRLWQSDQLVSDDVMFIHDEFVGYNYCHWLLDWLPRLSVLSEQLAAGEHVKLALTREPAQFQKQTLAMFGIDSNRIVVASHRLNEPNSFISLNRFFGVSSTNVSYKHALQGGAPWAAAALRTMLRFAKKCEVTAHIIVNRVSSRRLSFDERALEILVKCKFQEVMCEKLPIDQQIYVFNRARKIVAAHGAGLSNVVFCEEGAQLLEVFPPDYSTSAYYVVSQVVGVKYTCAVGRVAEHVGPQGHMRDHDLLVTGEIISEWLDLDSS